MSLGDSGQDVGPPPTTVKKIVTRYDALANEIAPQIRAGALPPGERMPSVRIFSRRRGLSSHLVLHAYHLPEDRGEIRAPAANEISAGERCALTHILL